MSRFRFDKRKIDVDSLLIKMGNNAVNYFKVDVFNEQAFDGKSWKPRQKDDGHRLLVKTGRMRASIRVLKRGRNYIQVGSDVSYAQYHNEGTSRLPQRKMIGKSSKISTYNRRTINAMIRESLHKK